MADSAMNGKQYVKKLIERARAAQRIAESFSQERVNELSTAIAWCIVKEDNVRALAKLAMEETRMGDYESKCLKIKKKIKGVQRDIKNAKSVGIIEDNPKTGIMKIAKPVGIIGAIIPCTNPTITPAIKAMNAIKGRNAIVCSPHPRSVKTTFKTVELMRAVLKKHGAPEDLIICPETSSKEISKEIMQQCDLIVATGGAAMVRAAYSSGTPAYGVGAGNVVVVVDETADLAEAAHKIMLSKTFDLASGCSCDNSVVVHESIYDAFLAALQKEGGFLTNIEQKRKLQDAMWVNGVLNKDVVAQPAKSIAELADFDIHENTKFIIVEEEGIGPEDPFSGEKMCVVLAVYKYHLFDDAIAMVNKIQSYQGPGHSCGIYSFDEDHILQLSLRTKTSRVMIRQPQNYGNSGDWCNGMPFTVTLGCGSWGGNITTENIVLKHYINITWVSRPIEAAVPSDEELFGDLISKDI